MRISLNLLTTRRFLPLFATQFLGAFNDNLYKTAMVMLVTYGIVSSESREAIFNAVANGLFILPFFLFSALAGQLADSHDKAAIVRIVKTCEIAIMVAGAGGLLLHSIPLLLLALFAMGVHSTFFGPVKYALLPQHLQRDEVLGGTGLVEAGTYAAILCGTMIGGFLQPTGAAALVLAIAMIGRLVSHAVPDAPPLTDEAHAGVDYHPLRSSWHLISATMHIPRLFLAIIAISFFWMQGAILASQFAPLVKNVLGGDQHIATLVLAIFSIGVATGSLAINRLLKGAVSARFAPAAAIAMGLFVCHLYVTLRMWPDPTGPLLDLRGFLALPRAKMVLFDLFGTAVAGGMFVVPLYAFLTTTVGQEETARTVAANNIVNSGGMVLGALILVLLVHLGASVPDTLLVVAVASIGGAAIAWRLHRACDAPHRGGYA
ncbi:MAG: MFS transporter [Sphingomonadaceae bacterium]|nr:MFS transporter [Sphingomonadaceae bacterium]